MTESRLHQSKLRYYYAGFSDYLIQRREMTVLQAYIDDSKKGIGRKRLFLAGYVTTVSNWVEFSNRWRAVLSSKPSIEYYKSTEAKGMRGQFRSWGRLDRDLKVRNLASVIRDHEPWSFHVSIDLKSFEEAFCKAGVPWGFRNAYWLAFSTVVAKVAEASASRGYSGPIDFIFDKQSEIHRSVNSLWDTVKASQPDHIRRFLSETPAFRDDKDVEALQAADMLVWHVQREFRNGILDPRESVSELIIRSGHHYYLDFDSKFLQQLGDTLHETGEFAKIDSKIKWKRILDEIDQMRGVE